MTALGMLVFTAFISSVVRILIFIRSRHEFTCCPREPSPRFTNQPTTSFRPIDELLPGVLLDEPAHLRGAFEEAFFASHLTGCIKFFSPITNQRPVFLVRHDIVAGQ
jgi:hypothetical protein